MGDSNKILGLEEIWKLTIGGQSFLSTWDYATVSRTLDVTDRYLITIMIGYCACFADQIPQIDGQNKRNDH